MGKLITVRSAVIMGISVAAGSVAGPVAEAVGQLTGHPLPGVGTVVTGAVTLWFAEKLDRLIADEGGSPSRMGADRAEPEPLRQTGRGVGDR